MIMDDFLSAVHLFKYSTAESFGLQRYSTAAKPSSIDGTEKASKDWLSVFLEMSGVVLGTYQVFGAISISGSTTMLVAVSSASSVFCFFLGGSCTSSSSFASSDFLRAPFQRCFFSSANFFLSAA